MKKTLLFVLTLSLLSSCGGGGKDPKKLAQEILRLLSKSQRNGCG